MTVPTIFDGITQLLGLRLSNNKLRFFTGLIGGLSLAILIKAIKYYILTWNEKLKRKLKFLEGVRVKVKCENCGKEYILEKGENPEDYQCECGGDLKSLFDIRNRPQPKTNKTSDSGNSFTDWWNNQSTNAKAGIGLGGICCIGIIVILAIFAMGGSDRNTENLTSTNIDTEPQTAQAQATWHSVAKFTGTGDKDTSSFNIKGNKFKVKITATADTNATEYAGIHFFAYPEGETADYDGQGSISNFNQNTMTDEFEVTATPGNYYLKVGSANLANWSIEVFDYY